MGERTIDGLRACITSIHTIIAPAIARSGDSLAREQVGLIAKYLDFLTKRLDDADAAVRHELEGYAGMAGEIGAVLSTASLQDPLTVPLATARALLDTPGAEKISIEAATDALKSGIARLVRSLGATKSDVRAKIDAIVVARSQPLIGFRRAWFAIQGWEADGAAIPDIKDLMRRSA